MSLCQSETSNPSATLVSIPDNVTNVFLTTLTSKEAWIGGIVPMTFSGHLIGSPVEWLDGSNSTSYTNWYDNSTTSVINPNPSISNIQSILNTIVKGYMSLNYNQSKGMWGRYLLTIRSLGSLCQYNPAQQP